MSCHNPAQSGRQLVESRQQQVRQEDKQHVLRQVGRLEGVQDRPREGEQKKRSRSSTGRTASWQRGTSRGREGPFKKLEREQAAVRATDESGDSGSGQVHLQGRSCQVPEEGGREEEVSREDRANYAYLSLDRSVRISSSNRQYASKVYSSYGALSSDYLLVC